jgi:hypothetical protein
MGAAFACGLVRCLAGLAKASPDKATSARMITTNLMASDYAIFPRDRRSPPSRENNFAAATSEMYKKREKTPQITQHNGVVVEAG